MIEHLNKSDPEGGKVKVIISKEKAVSLTSKNRGVFFYFCDLDSVHSFVCVQI